MKVLVTAFKPFNNQKNNYSEEVLKYITNVDKLIIDVVYDESYKDITKCKNLDDYELIIALGEARSRSELTLETQAINLSSCSLKDNKGVLISEEEYDNIYNTYKAIRAQISEKKYDIKEKR